MLTLLVAAALLLASLGHQRLGLGCGFRTDFDEDRVQVAHVGKSSVLGNRRRKEQRDRATDKEQHAHDW